MVSSLQCGAINPWMVQNLSDFFYLCCPECDYRTKVEDFFEHHAVNKHPMSINFFSAEVLDVPDKALDDVKILNGFIIKPEECIGSDILKDESEEYFKQNYITQESSNMGCCDSLILEPETKIEVDNDIAHIGLKTELSEKENNIAVNFKNRKFRPPVIEDPDPHNCMKCGIEVVGLRNLAVHLKNEHDKDSERWQCPACESSSPNHEKLKKHITSVHLKPKVSCPTCGKMMHQTKLREHTLYAHETNRDIKPFKCDQCDFSSHAIRYLKAHVKTVHEKEKHKVQCDECGKKYLFQSELRLHKEVCHEGIKRRGNVKKYQYMCDKCGKSFQAKRRLQVHTMSDACEAQEPIKCEKCNDTFTGRKYYIVHYKNIHGGDPKHLSPYNEGEFMCDQCPNGYMTKQALSKHIMSAHLGIRDAHKEKLRKCDHCEKTFSTSGGLKEHVLVKHENRTPHQCDQCHRSYGTKAKLLSHTRNMHRRVKCDECDQEICNNFMLKRHKASVHNTKPTNVYQCEFCPLFYDKETFLDKHLAKHHLQL